MKHFFRYQIFRYIADLRRMEPENVGILVQGQGINDVACQFRTQLGNRKNFDFDNYRRWREFLEVEICEPAVPLFQPPRNSVEFLLYLQSRCAGNYSLTRPLELALDTPDLKVALDLLFKTLVLKPNEVDNKARQPVRLLREELEKREILKHPAFKKRELFKADGVREFVDYHYLRNHGSNLPVLIQPVQVLPNIVLTVNAMERAEALVKLVREADVKAEISVVVDEMPAPPRDAEETRKWAFDKLQSGKEELRNLDVQVVDSTTQTRRLADGIEKDLNEIEVKSAQPALEFA